MPKVLVPIKDLDQSVTREVVTEVIQQVRQETGLPLTASMWYPGPDGKSYQPGSTVAPDTDYLGNGENNLNGRMGGTPQLTLEVVEEPNRDRTLGTATYQPENLFIFIDDKLGVYIKPAYSYTDVTITVRFRAQSETQAAAWRNEMRQRVSMNRDVRLYDVTYSYYVAPAYIAILQEIHRLRENVDGYGDTFENYLTSHASSKATIIVTSAGTMPRLVMPETQIRVQGVFDFDAFPETGQRDEGGATWTASFAVKFSYERPQTQVMFYPLFIHQQPLDQKWRPDVPPFEVAHQQKSFALSTLAMERFKGERTGYSAMMDFGYQIPYYDEFVPQARIPNTKNVVTIALGLDTENRRNLFSLKELGDFTLDPDIEDFMAGEAPYMTTNGQSIFILYLYQGNSIMNNGVLAVDSDLNVTSTIDLDYRQMYHARLALRWDMTNLSLAAQTRLQRHCAAACKIFDGLDGRIKFNPGLPICLPNDQLRALDYKKMNSIINRSSARDSQGRSYIGILESNVGNVLLKTFPRVR